MTVINMLDAKSNLSRLVASVETGMEDEITIARNGRPAARLVAIKSTPPGKRIGVAKGKFVVPESIDADDAAIAALLTAANEAAARYIARTYRDDRDAGTAARQAVRQDAGGSGHGGPAATLDA